MDTKLSYLPSETPKMHDKAISLCLYKSDRFKYDKHITPFEKFLQGTACIDYDILLFYKDESLITYTMRNAPNHNIRLFKITSDETGYLGHIWRYLGAHEDYRWIWFRGLDSPEIHKRELILENCATLMNCDIIKWACITYDCHGRVAISKNLHKNLTDHIRSFTYEKNLSKLWHCDEMILSDWTTKNIFKTLIALDKSTIDHPWMEDKIIQSLRHGNHTIVIKDRDDSHNVNKK